MTLRGTWRVIFSGVCLQLRWDEQLMALVDHLLDLAGLVHLEVVHELHLLLLVETIGSGFLTPTWVEVVRHLVALVRSIVFVVKRRRERHCRRVELVLLRHCKSRVPLGQLGECRWKRGELCRRRVAKGRYVRIDRCLWAWVIVLLRLLG